MKNKNSNRMKAIFIRYYNDQIMIRDAVSGQFVFIPYNLSATYYFNCNAVLSQTESLLIKKGFKIVGHGVIDSNEYVILCSDWPRGFDWIELKSKSEE